VRLGVLTAAQATPAAFDMPQRAVRGIRGLADGGTIESPRIRTTGIFPNSESGNKTSAGVFLWLGMRTRDHRFRLGSFGMMNDEVPDTHGQFTASALRSLE
jgi:hypothetical protein